MLNDHSITSPHNEPQRSSGKFHGKTSVSSGLQLYQKDTPTLMFSYGICGILNNTYFEEHLRKSASICFTSKYYNK